jgi:putative flippase GtrA
MLVPAGLQRVLRFFADARKHAAQAARFAIVGLTATGVHFATLFLLADLVAIVSPPLASGIGSVLGIAVSYLGNRGWTFRRTESHRQFVPGFLIVYALTMSGHTALMYLQVDALALHYAPAFVIATAISTAANFLLSKFLVFERRLVEAVPTRVA